MEIKMTIQGGLVYANMLCYLTAMFCAILKKLKISERFYLLGFLISVISWIYRWVHVGHIPMQNMFEVFLTMGMALWPLTMFCRRFLGAGLEAGDMLLGTILLFPAGFIFEAEPQALPPALQSPLFAPHVAVYMLSYVILAKAAFQAIGQLYYAWIPGREKDALEYELKAYWMVRLGFPLLTLGLILGSWWGARAWGDYWGWDPKELWSLASWLMYLLYFHWRYIFGRKYAQINGILALLGLIAIIITLLWVNLSKKFGGLHNYATS